MTIPIVLSAFGGLLHSKIIGLERLKVTYTVLMLDSKTSINSDKTIHNQIEVVFQLTNKKHLVDGIEAHVYELKYDPR